MRTAVTSLILAAGLVSAAQAQQAAAPAPAAAAATTAAPPAAQAPLAPAATPAAEPPKPSLPTTGTGAQIISAIESICLPAVRGQGVDVAAKAAKLRQNKRDGTWSMPLGGAKDYVVLFQGGGSQKDVCAAEVRFAPGDDKAIVSALNIWSYLHKPELVLQANYVNVDPDGVKRTRKSWEGVENGVTTAVNFSLMRKPDDSLINARYDTGMLFYQERTGG